jgi:Uma2 family endonuclease
VGKLKSTAWTVADYDRAALSYSRRLPLEHFMEGIPQSTQRKITLESLDLLSARIPDLQVFNELLIQYFRKGRLRRVVPDNMLRRSSRPPVTGTSYNLELEGGPPLLVFEYVSPSSHRKDYGDSFSKYEEELRVPYCLIYYPDKQDLQVWRHTGQRYERVTADAEGRLAIADLELQVGVRDGWVRFWHQGELLPLPAELQRQLDDERRRAQQEKQRAEQEKQRAEQEKQRAEQEKQRAVEEKRLRDAAEAEVARLKALLEQAQSSGRQPRKR